MRVIAGDGYHEMNLRYVQARLEKTLQTQAYSDDDHDRGKSHDYKRGLLKPCFAVLNIESHINNVSHEIRLTREFFANGSAERGGGGGGISTEHCGDGDEEKVGNGIVSTESDTREIILSKVAA